MEKCHVDPVPGCWHAAMTNDVVRVHYDEKVTNEQK